MRIGNPRYVYLGWNGEELPAGELGHAALKMDVEGMAVTITTDNCRYLAYGYRLVSVPELVEVLPPIEFPGSEDGGLSPQTLMGYTSDPVVYCLARDFYGSVVALTEDPEAFEPGPAPTLPPQLAALADWD